MTNLIPTREVAARLGCSTQYVHKLVAAGKLTPATPRIPRQSMWFDEQDINEFDRKRNKNNPPP